MTEFEHGYPLDRPLNETEIKELVSELTRYDSPLWRIDESFDSIMNAFGDQLKDALAATAVTICDNSAGRYTHQGICNLIFGWIAKEDGVDHLREVLADDIHLNTVQAGWAAVVSVADVASAVAAANVSYDAGDSVFSVGWAPTGDGILVAAPRAWWKLHDTAP